MALARSLPRRLTPALLAALVLALGAAPAASAGRGCVSTRATPDETSTAQLTESTLCLLNAQRARAGLRALRLNEQLSEAALRHATDMERRHYFSHTSRNGSTFVQRIRRTGYFRRVSSWFVGENLAWGAGRNRSTPRGIVAAWMDSPPHKANILQSRFREIGIGVTEGAPRRNVFGLPAATYATTFGARS
ncbi:MAG TPA: CAP domain-containing protein [Thermoleophilaceae bacterium]|nr:CAP domain-containing protein [Thermoleophilaceae bacterium]